MKLDRKIQRVFYSRSTDRVRIIFDDRTIFVVPCRLLEGLDGADTHELRAIEVLENGPALEWPLLGVKHSVPQLLNGLYGSKRWMAGLDRLPKISSARSAARVAERSASFRARGFLGDEFVVVTNMRAGSKPRKLR